MSGHSKWATTKNKKAASDAKKANAFTKLARNIMVAARAGDDPEMNFKLRLAIDKARSASMPKDNIERAIAKGAGKAEGVQLEEVFYEAIGPHGTAFIIEGVTDNKNRTTPEIKGILFKYGGTLAGNNAVKWQFEHKGVIHIKKESIKDKDELTLSLIDLGADDVIEDETGMIVYCQANKFEPLKKELEAKDLNPAGAGMLDYAEIEWVAKDCVELSEENRAKVDDLINLLEEQDDVNNVYTNVK